MANISARILPLGEMPTIEQLTPFASLPALPAGAVVQAMVAACSEKAAWRHLEFFAANVCNPNARAAYARAASSFFAWCDGLD